MAKVSGTMLNIMENFLSGYGPYSAAGAARDDRGGKASLCGHVALRRRSRFGPVPVSEMPLRKTGKRRAGLINMDKASCKSLAVRDQARNLAAHGRETIYLSTSIRSNIVSMIQSNYAGYGTGMVARRAPGFSFHNRGAGFDVEPGKPNSLA